MPKPKRKPSPASRPSRDAQTRNLEPGTRNAPLPAADAALARRRETELVVQDKTIGEINKAVATYREKARNILEGMVSLVNDGRKIGLLIQGIIDQLPGKQMTLDFWQQYESRFIDRKGTPITLEQIKYFVRLAKNHPQPITTPAEARQALQLAFAAGNFNLIGDRAPGIAHEHVPFNEFMSLFNGYKPLLNKLAKDPNIGPIDQWPADRRERAWLEIKPFYDEVIVKLKPVDM